MSRGERAPLKRKKSSGKACDMEVNKEGESKGASSYRRNSRDAPNEAISVWRMKKIKPTGMKALFEPGECGKRLRGNFKQRIRKVRKRGTRTSYTVLEGREPSWRKRNH